MIDGVIAFYLSEGSAEVTVARVGGDVGKLLIKVLGYCGVLGANLIVAISGGERDGLVGGDFGAFPGEIPDGAPKFLYVGSMGDGGDEGPPSRAGGGLGQGVDPVIKGTHFGVSRVQGPTGITFPDELLDLRAGRRVVFFAVAGGDCHFCGI